MTRCMALEDLGPIQKQARSLTANSRDGRNHHRRMAEILVRLGRPRPSKDHQLSLINPASPSSYWGRRLSTEKGVKRRSWVRLSSNPEDYAWETASENNNRKASQIIQLYVQGFLTEEGRPILHEGDYGWKDTRAGI